MPVEVCDYNPEWPMLFQSLRDLYIGRLQAVRVPIVSIEHVGSTSVPGLAAKPVLDIDIVVLPEHVPAASTVLESLGFAPLGELGIPDRWAFRSPEDLPVTATYIVLAGSLALRNHLAVRETLRANTRLRDEYSVVKRTVGAWAADIFEYGGGKNDMVQRILSEAGLSQEELTSIAGHIVPGPEVPR